MFERFTRSARTIVVDAQQQARGLHHRQVTADHLLLAVLARADGPDTDGPAGVLRRLGVARDALLRRVAVDADAEALHSIGVDLQAVRSRVEAAFGAGALDRPRTRRTGLLRRRRVDTGGHLPFDASAKRALEQSLRAALSLGHGAIGVAVFYTKLHNRRLLGLLADDRDLAARTLRDLGVAPADVRTGEREALRGTA